MPSSVSRTVAVGCAAIPASLIVLGIVGLATGSWRVGSIWALVSLGVFFLVAFANLYFVREISWFDVFLPIPLSAFWALMMLPVTLVASGGFNSAECIGAGFLLTLTLWFIKWRRLSMQFVIFPVLVLLYEMIPVDIPGPFDEIFSFTGDVVTVAFTAFGKFARTEVAAVSGGPVSQLPGEVKNHQLDHLPPPPAG